MFRLRAIGARKRLRSITIPERSFCLFFIASAPSVDSCNTPSYYLYLRKSKGLKNLLNGMRYKQSALFLLVGLLLPFLGKTQCGNLVPPEPCLVTVDSNDNNVVVWEDEENSAVDSFFCYREIGSTPTQLAGVSADSLGVWSDSDPDKTDSARYFLAKSDTCGNRSPIGTYHRTIFLTTALNNDFCVELFWSPYVGFTPTGGVILRDTTGTGENFELIDSIAPGTTSYEDFEMCSPLPDSIVYVIKVFPPDTCTATRAEDYNSSRSNRGTITSTGISEHSGGPGAVLKASPLPGKTGVFKLVLPDKDRDYKYRITDITGRVIQKGAIHAKGDPTYTLEIADRSRGVYFIDLSSSGHRWSTRILR